MRIPAAQLSVWLCLETGSLSGAAGPAGGLVHPAATPSCRQTTQDTNNYKILPPVCETIATPMTAKQHFFCTFCGFRTSVNQFIHNYSVRK